MGYPANSPRPLKSVPWLSAGAIGRLSRSWESFRFSPKPALPAAPRAVLPTAASKSLAVLRRSWENWIIEIAVYGRSFAGHSGKRQISRATIARTAGTTQRDTGDGQSCLLPPKRPAGVTTMLRRARRRCLACLLATAAAVLVFGWPANCRAQVAPGDIVPSRPYFTTLIVYNDGDYRDRAGRLSGRRPRRHQDAGQPLDRFDLLLHDGR